MGLSICRKDAVEWLTDERWIVFSFYGGFAHHLEHCYFTPGTPKITLSNVVLTAYSVKNGQKGTIANDISGEAQSVATSTF